MKLFDFIAHVFRHSHNGHLEIFEAISFRLFPSLSRSTILLFFFRLYQSSFAIFLAFVIFLKLSEMKIACISRRKIARKKDYSTYVDKSVYIDISEYI